MFAQREEREEELHSEKFCPKRQKGVIICPSKKGEGEKSKAGQKRSKKSRPLSGKARYDRVRSPDRLQNNSMLPFHLTNRKKRLYQPWLAAGANRKIAHKRFFCKNYLCNSNGFFILSASIFSFYFTAAPQKVSFN